MKKKLFVWGYTHYPDRVTTCALTEDGKLLASIDSPIDYNEPRSEVHQKQHKENVRLFFGSNDAIAEEYDVHIQNQSKLEKHMYDGGDRVENVPEDFRIAWDKAKLGEAVVN